MSNLILNIPHSSDILPDMAGYVISAQELEKEILRLTDWYTKELFENDYDKSICADFSRIFCDIERFIDDEKEIMSKHGMGVLYEKTDDGRLMRKVTSELRNRIIEKHYIPHHKRLEQAVEDSLNKHKKALIVDCHSFSDIPFQRDLIQNKNRPDINIGTDDFHTDKKLIDFSNSYFLNYGFTVGINVPYSGSLVPMKFYQTNINVQSIMIEINRKLYLKSDSNEKTGNFHKIQKVIREYLGELRNKFL